MRRSSCKPASRERWVVSISAGSVACWGASELLLDGSGTHRSTRTASGHRPEVCSARGVSSLKAPSEDALRLSRAIVDAKERVSFCSRCFNLSEGGDECAICLDPRRETRMVCVVEDSQDIVAIERTQEFRGRYHVLQGAFSPIDGVGVEQLRGRNSCRVSLMRTSRRSSSPRTPTSRERRPRRCWSSTQADGVRVSRIASGLPVGGDLEYADELTLGRALEGRTVLDTGDDSQP